jgi:hypothetical protein
VKSWPRNKLLCEPCAVTMLSYEILVNLAQLWTLHAAFITFFHIIMPGANDVIIAIQACFGP